MERNNVLPQSAHGAPHTGLPSRPGTLQPKKRGARRSFRASSAIESALQRQSAWTARCGLRSVARAKSKTRCSDEFAPAAGDCPAKAGSAICRAHPVRATGSGLIQYPRQVPSRRGFCAGSPAGPSAAHRKQQAGRWSPGCTRACGEASTCDPAVYRHPGNAGCGDVWRVLRPSRIR